MESKTMSEWYREIGKRIFSIRDVNGLTQEQMAEILKISTSRQYQKIEYGESRIAIEQIAELGERFGVTSDFILYGTVISNKDYEYDFFNHTEAEQLVLFFDIAKKVFKVPADDFTQRLKNYCDNLPKGR